MLIAQPCPHAALKHEQRKLISRICALATQYLLVLYIMTRTLYKVIDNLGHDQQQGWIAQLADSRYAYPKVAGSISCCRQVFLIHVLQVQICPSLYTILSVKLYHEVILHFCVYLHTEYSCQAPRTDQQPQHNINSMSKICRGLYMIVHRPSGFLSPFPVKY